MAHSIMLSVLDKGIGLRQMDFLTSIIDNKRMKKLILTIFILTAGGNALAQKKYSPSQVPRMPRVTAPKEGAEFKYDVTASSGKYNDTSYTELNLGLNWQMGDWWVWRNAAFHRFGSGMDSTTGLDTSLRVGSNVTTDDGSLGVEMFVGPGYRFANNNSNALFGEAGLGFKIAGIYLGVGAKSLYYTQTRTDSNGKDLSKNDTQVFLVVGGGGSF